MPIYEYQCAACGHHLEALQKISESPLRKCPDCGKSRLKRLISPPVFRLKGGGWYETDFKSDKEEKRNLSGPDKEEPKAEGKPESKEGKPEAKEAKPADSKTPQPKPAEAKSTAAGRRAGKSARGKRTRRRR